MLRTCVCVCVFFLLLVAVLFFFVEKMRWLKDAVRIFTQKRSGTFNPDDNKWLAPLGTCFKAEHGPAIDDQNKIYKRAKAASVCKLVTQRRQGVVGHL